jgi:hypothetical protein
VEEDAANFKEGLIRVRADFITTTSKRLKKRRISKLCLTRIKDKLDLKKVSYFRQLKIN